MGSLGRPSNHMDGIKAGRRGPPLGGKLASLDKLVNDMNAERIPLDLTFGVELEFILLGDVGSVWDSGAFGGAGMYRHTSPLSALLLVYKALTEPVTAPCAGCGEQHIFTLPVAKPASCAGFDPRGWTITTDGSVYLAPVEHAVYPDRIHHGLELVSRVFQKGKPLMTTDSETDALHRHSITTEQEITLILQKLTDSFNKPESSGEERANNRVVVNASCGFHVHVGNGLRSIGFPLPTVKNLFALQVAHERAIDSISHFERIGGASASIAPLYDLLDVNRPMMPHSSCYNMPNSAFFIWHAAELLRAYFYHVTVVHESLPQYPRNGLNNPIIKKAAFSFEPSDFVQLIMSAGSVEDLKAIFSRFDGHHRNTFNLQNLGEYGFDPTGNGKVTVEFRQGASALEPGEVLGWIDMVTSMVQFSHSSNVAKMRKHLDTALKDPNFDALRLLSSISCKASTVQLYKHILGQDESGIDYATLRAEKQRQIAGQIQDKALQVRLHIIDSRAAALDPVRIRAKISAKFKMGGYGRFSASYLDQYEPALSSEDKHRLTSGTVITASPLPDEILGDIETLEQEMAGLGVTSISSEPSSATGPHPDIDGPETTHAASSSLPTETSTKGESVEDDEDEQQPRPSPDMPQLPPTPAVRPVADVLQASTLPPLPPPLHREPVVIPHTSTLMRCRRRPVPDLDLPKAH